ncbi:sulfite exporter TauE/SafE family protein [Moraxella nasovis]|uniref:sulfite exporter TauE/SafE family protein n=1 Tax=Moraxella nasovis TaxID=2904121 RepID=UPI001F609E3F|nr:sulfite exporter TauE/SafE family protein [Moraxella nasovis]UNU73849.1 sulfite exporter TauE/SafE family protein [Moraxella nasovis]
MMYVWFMAAGIVAGLCAGLFGVGGGLIIVPALVWIFLAYGMPSEIVPHVAVGTALATIIITSISSLSAHHKKGGVRWDIFKNIAKGLVLGSLFGAWVATLIKGDYLQGIIGVFAIAMSLKMFMKKANQVQNRPLPKDYEQGMAGVIIGAMSAVFGIGGGSLTVPYLTHVGLPIKQAVGTSSACGLPIALAGAIGFMWFGHSAVENMNVAGLVGFVHLPAFVMVSVMSFMTAKVGAKFAHKLPATTLKKAFACLLFFVGCQLIYGAVA